MTNTHEMPALPDDLFWRVRPLEYYYREYEGPENFLVEVERYISDYLYEVVLIKKAGSNSREVITEGLVNEYRHTSYGERYHDRVPETTSEYPRDEILCALPLAETLSSRNREEKGYLTAWGKAVNTTSSYYTSTRQRVKWYNPYELTDENVARTAKTLWELFIVSEHSAALADNIRWEAETHKRKAMRTAEVNYSRLVGDYPPKKLGV